MHFIAFLAKFFNQTVRVLAQLIANLIAHKLAACQLADCHAKCNHFAGQILGVCKVALTVNADDAMLDALTQAVPLDMLQLHGSESPARVAEVKARYGLPVMKAVGVAERADLAQLDAYAGVADQLLVDAKPPKGADLPGGNGLAFDWQLLAGRVWRSPWMLAGGLKPDNVAEAIRRTGARQVDVSSGVERRPGIKDAALIHALVAAALNA